jgi:heme/copper-type cytochrome/quinol oxidase subunit 1
MLVFLVNMVFAFVRKAPAGANPWGRGATTLEWSLSSPPPFHQFDTLPRIVGPRIGDAGIEGGPIDYREPKSRAAAARRL